MRIYSGRLRWVLFAALLMTGLSACGQKGDLYLPESSQTSIEADLPALS